MLCQTRVWDYEKSAAAGSEANRRPAYLFFENSKYGQQAFLNLSLSKSWPTITRTHSVTYEGGEKTVGSGVWLNIFVSICTRACGSGFRV